MIAVPLACHRRHPSRRGPAELTRALLPTLLLAPFIPGHLDDLPGRAWVGGIHFLVLDCPDDERRRRIEARPRWRARDIDEQTAFGRWLRDNLKPVIDTTSQSPSQVADAVAAWVRERLAA